MESHYTDNATIEIVYSHNENKYIENVRDHNGHIDFKEQFHKK